MIKNANQKYSNYYGWRFFMLFSAEWHYTFLPSVNKEKHACQRSFRRFLPFRLDGRRQYCQGILTQYGRISARQNRIRPRQPMVFKKYRILRAGA